MFTDFKIFIFALLIGAFVFQFFIFTTWFSTTVSSMSDSESSDNGLSENEELGHDEEMEDDGSEWEDASSDEDDDEPPARRVRQELTEGYDTADTYRPAVPFNPRRPTGPQLADQTRQDAILQFSKEVDFFKLFFSVALLQKLWDFTNAYAQEHIDDNPTYQNKAKGWDLISVSEMYGFIACLIDLYGLHAVTLARVLLVLCIIASLDNGNWVCRMISFRDRFRAIMAFFRCNDHTAMDNNEKLRHVWYLIDNVKQSCQEFFPMQQGSCSGWENGAIEAQIWYETIQ